MRVTQMRQLIAAAKQAGNDEIVASVQALMQHRADVVSECKAAGGLLASLVSNDLAEKATARESVRADVQAERDRVARETRERKAKEKQAKKDAAAKQADNPPITRHARKQAAAPKVAPMKGKGATLPVRKPAAATVVPTPAATPTAAPAATPATTKQATGKAGKQAKSA